jgi:hypothetical protein
MMSAFNEARYRYWRFEQAVARTIFVHIIGFLFPNRLALLSRLRTLVRALVPASVILFALGCLIKDAFLAGAGGLLMDAAAAIKLTISTEWDGLIEDNPQWTDEELYPFGPPSHITREMFAEDSPEALGDEPPNPDSMATYMWHRRGFIMFLFGAVMQLIALWVAVL